METRFPHANRFSVGLSEKLPKITIQNTEEVKPSQAHCIAMWFYPSDVLRTSPIHRRSLCSIISIQCVSHWPSFSSVTFNNSARNDVSRHSCSIACIGNISADLHSDSMRVKYSKALIGESSDAHWKFNAFGIGGLDKFYHINWSLIVSNPIL